MQGASGRGTHCGQQHVTEHQSPEHQSPGCLSIQRATALAALKDAPVELLGELRTPHTPSPRVQERSLNQSAAPLPRLALNPPAPPAQTSPALVGLHSAFSWPPRNRTAHHHTSRHAHTCSAPTSAPRRCRPWNAVSPRTRPSIEETAAALRVKPFDLPGEATTCTRQGTEPWNRPSRAVRRFWRLAGRSIWLPAHQASFDATSDCSIGTGRAPREGTLPAVPGSRTTAHPAASRTPL